MVGMRRDLIDKIVKKMEGSPLFTKDCKYPRRYFDDLVIETQTEASIIHKQETVINLKSGLFDTVNLRNKCTEKKTRPFLDVSGRKAEAVSTKVFATL